MLQIITARAHICRELSVHGSMYRCSCMSAAFVAKDNKSWHQPLVRLALLASDRWRLGKLQPYNVVGWCRDAAAPLSSRTCTGQSVAPCPERNTTACTPRSFETSVGCWRPSLQRGSSLLHNCSCHDGESPEPIREAANLRRHNQTCIPQRSAPTSCVHQPMISQPSRFNRPKSPMSRTSRLPELSAL